MAEARGNALSLLDGHFAATALLRPFGGHLLEVQGAIGVATFTRDMIPRLREVLDDFDREVSFEDRRPSERSHPHRLQLAGRR